MRQQSSAGCLTGLVAAFSRIMLLMMWISRPVAWEATFGGIILPCLGWLFLPITTMVYAWLMQGVGAIQGLDWLWLFLAFLLDLATIGSAGYANRERMPGRTSQPTLPPQNPTGTP